MAPAYRPTADEILAVFHRIGYLQQPRKFMIISFYVDRELIEVITPALKPDDPPSGAVGRYYGIPVFPKDSDIDADLERRSEDFVEYTFLRCLAVG